ncbi:hydroxysteroid 11-beta-dehydrogenase 1-like protein B [Podarcis raffonei]|uniref:hydroxysteroid 11-beta-dehydrogenase 1-like protein B n=1 Tax=Podarcis raffonei TaxID=65483 RepID=UPI00232911A9|nr:hydroxysteroid 11-beta-dehydrogenase 1-like protein B [Podarcis raffonei]
MAVLKIVAPVLIAVLVYYAYTWESFSEEMVRGKRVLVTGSSTGIGEQMAYEFAWMGAHLMLTARNETRLQKVVQNCLKLGAASASYVVSDMSDLASARNVVEETKNVLGGLDLLVLNHVGGKIGFGPYQGDMESVISSMTVNFFSYVQVTVSALSMLQESRGNIIVVSSISGRLPSPFSVPYAASKAALEGFYSSLRTELRLREINMPITVAVLGYIDTDTAVRSVEGKMSLKASSKELCAQAIVRGGVMRVREVFFPYWLTKPVLLLRDWVPGVVDQIIGNSYVLEKIL